MRYVEQSHPYSSFLQRLCTVLAIRASDLDLDARRGPPGSGDLLNMKMRAKCNAAQVSTIQACKNAFMTGSDDGLCNSEVPGPFKVAHINKKGL